MSNDNRSHDLAARLGVNLPARTTARQQRELVAFVRYCVARIERDIGSLTAWSIELVTERAIYACRVSVRDRDTAIEATRSGTDPTLAIWDALCKIEMLVLEARSQRLAEPKLAAM